MLNVAITNAPDVRGDRRLYWKLDEGIWRLVEVADNVCAGREAFLSS